MDPPGSYGGYGGVDTVKGDFARLQLARPNVHFLVGWFKDTLPPTAGADIKRLAVLRLDGDMYESTMLVLETMYPLVSVGGCTFGAGFPHCPPRSVYLPPRDPF